MRLQTDRPINIRAHWAGQEHNCALAVTTWNRIVSGYLVSRGTSYYQDGQEYKSEWTFNSNAQHVLRITYSQSTGTSTEGLAFEGKLSDLDITFENKFIEIKKVIKKNKLYTNCELFNQELHSPSKPITHLSIFFSRKKEGHAFKGIVNDANNRIICQYKISKIISADVFYDHLLKFWMSQFTTPISAEIMKIMLKNIESKDPELAAQLIALPALNHALSIFELS